MITRKNRINQHTGESYREQSLNKNITEYNGEQKVNNDNKLEDKYK